MRRVVVTGLGHGFAARLRRRGHLAAPAEQRKRRQEDRYVRRFRPCQPRSPAVCRAATAATAHSIPISGWSRRTSARSTISSSSPWARRARRSTMQAGARRPRRTVRHRHLDRLGNRRPRPASPRPSITAEGARSAQAVAVLHPGPPDQSRLRIRLDRARPEGPQPLGGHRLLDRRACHRRRRPADCARRCRRDGRRRHRIADQPDLDRRVLLRCARCPPVSTTRPKRRRAPTTGIATAS